ncbi:hypothetical protein TeGR_g2725, partial [Tetraparma gracilis]
RLTEFNGDSSSYVMMIEEGNLDNPRGVACVNETACVVANEKSHEIRMIIGGEDKGIVATGSPSGVTYVAHLDLIMVCKLAGNGGVYLFDPRNGDQEEEDAVGAIPTNPALNIGRPQKVVIGEFDNEVLFSTLDRTVIRFCLPATAGGEGCNPARNAIMVSSSNALIGLAVIRETGKFLVAEKTDNKVYECELDVTGITTSQCEIFAFSPTSDTYVKPPLTTVAGEQITAPVVLLDPHNRTVDETHTKDPDALQLRVTATGFIPGTDIPATIAGDFITDDAGSLSAVVTVEFAGTWS